MIKITGYFIVFGIIIIALCDIFMLAYGGVPSTISSVLFHDSKVSPMIPLAFGILVGHLFWQNK